MWRRAELAVARSPDWRSLPERPEARGAEPRDEFVKGVFSPNFVPPAAGSYELPPVKRVRASVEDSTGRAVSTERITAEKSPS